ncbi:MAG TPA: hypothetical protein VF837_04230 [Patescibacteria group bacterium]
MRIQLDQPVNNEAFEKRFSNQFSPMETSEFEEAFEGFFAQVGYFCDQRGEFDYVKFTRWLEVRFFVDTSKRTKFTNLHDYIERILTFFIGSEVLPVWQKLNHTYTCPEPMWTLNRLD